MLAYEADIGETGGACAMRSAVLAMCAGAATHTYFADVLGV